jgi:predicted N-formylglutamate amidohydrolase
VRDDLIERYHRPHHDTATRHVEGARSSGARVLHLGIHSFTPQLDGRPRTADLGVLYDPGRPGEAAFASRLASSLKRLLPGWSVRRNYPYRGVADGLVTVLRRRFGDADYLGIEVEVSQSRLSGGGRFPDRVVSALVEAVQEGLAG